MEEGGSAEGCKCEEEKEVVRGREIGDTAGCNTANIEELLTAILRIS